MGINKTILLTSIIVICCVAGSAGATFYIMHNINQNKIQELTTYHQTRISNLTSYFQHRISILQHNLSDMNEDILRLNHSLQENVSELEKLQSGNKYQLHDPTYDEVSSFISNDKTDESTYDKESFNCQHFSQIVNDNAEAQGIKCAVVLVYFEETNTGHMIVGFNTVDQGMVYVEPQSDEWVENLEKGNEYWTDCVVPKGGYYYEEDPSDTIKEVFIFW